MPGDPDHPRRHALEVEDRDPLVVRLDAQDAARAPRRRPRRRDPARFRCRPSERRYWARVRRSGALPPRPPCCGTAGTRSTAARRSPGAAAAYRGGPAVSRPGPEARRDPASAPRPRTGPRRPVASRRRGRAHPAPRAAGALRRSSTPSAGSRRPARRRRNAVGLPGGCGPPHSDRCRHGAFRQSPPIARRGLRAPPGGAPGCPRYGEGAAARPRSARRVAAPRGVRPGGRPRSARASRSAG